MVKERRLTKRTSARTVMVRKFAKRRRSSMQKSIKEHRTTKLITSMVKLTSILVLKLVMLSLSSKSSPTKSLREKEPIFLWRRKLLFTKL